MRFDTIPHIAHTWLGRISGMASTTNRRRFLALGVGAAIAGCLGSEPPVADDDAAR
ncbi:hypothetical protein D320_17344, partial [Haloferax sp. BAB-2207]